MENYLMSCLSIFAFIMVSLYFFKDSNSSEVLNVTDDYVDDFSGRISGDPWG